MKPADFISMIGPAAQESSEMSGIPASFTIAQAALESAWGESQLAKDGCNLFGVKAGKIWTGATLTLPTKECIKGVWVNCEAVWRKYPDWLASIDDHSRFLILNPRYKLAFTGHRTGEDFARMVQACGYATDPRYADKIISIIRQHKLNQYDLPTS